jgi:uncharacterized membrane protein YeaQ/YmgE (transglycosylase-associated protein family)
MSGGAALAGQSCRCLQIPVPGVELVEAPAATHAVASDGGTTVGIISWIVLGAIAGYLAGFLVKGDEGLGVIGHIVLGIVGALVGGFLARVLLNIDPVDGALDVSSIVAAVVGAVIVVWVVGLFSGRQTRRSI